MAGSIGFCRFALRRANPAFYPPRRARPAVSTLSLRRTRGAAGFKTTGDFILANSGTEFFAPIDYLVDIFRWQKKRGPKAA
ncbi:hypothetical protein [Paraburkholderia acidisoli]|uniref:Uncharacterized protein n=1 Tax=Paraburkholderia acidisoli TaxID=2571748 RepID=A0A7Z2GN15_9BURK|nr:hypothetical protein [Paraburkholderia acidisoli]QGZ64399.1 hypothetical protein FAZ98_22025 [Paraburkholderia acidisoli]